MGREHPFIIRLAVVDNGRRIHKAHERTHEKLGELGIGFQFHRDFLIVRRKAADSLLDRAAFLCAAGRHVTSQLHEIHFLAVEKRLRKTKAVRRMDFLQFLKL